MTVSGPVWQVVRSAGLVGIVVAGLLTAAGAGQHQPSPAASRQLVQDTSLPAIDRGLRDQDPPRAARGRDDAGGHGGSTAGIRSRLSAGICA